LTVCSLFVALRISIQCVAGLFSSRRSDESPRCGAETRPK
jgi:hypothetical protein